MYDAGKTSRCTICVVMLRVQWSTSHPIFSQIILHAQFDRGKGFLVTHTRHIGHWGIGCVALVTHSWHSSGHWWIRCVTLVAHTWHASWHWRVRGRALVSMTHTGHVRHRRVVALRVAHTGHVRHRRIVTL